MKRIHPDPLHVVRVLIHRTKPHGGSKKLKIFESQVLCLRAANRVFLHASLNTHRVWVGAILGDEVDSPRRLVVEPLHRRVKQLELVLEVVFHSTDSTAGLNRGPAILLGEREASRSSRVRQHRSGICDPRPDVDDDVRSRRVDTCSLETLARDAGGCSAAAVPHRACRAHGVDI